MIKLGIIGAENSHSHNIGRILNNDKALPMRATHLWGETPEFAAASAKLGNIPEIVDDWKSMVGKVDAIMIDHRDGAHHYEVARHFIQAGLPVFVDKPMCNSLAEAKRLFAMAAKRKVPICTFSAIPLQTYIKDIHKSLKKHGPAIAINSSGPVEIDSRYGGIFFYGIHQVDTIVDLLGNDARTAFLQRNGNNGTGVIHFASGAVATINCIAKGGVFQWQVCCDCHAFGVPHQPDAQVYRESAKKIYRLARFGEVPWSRERMLAPIAILEALQKSLASGKVEKVGKL